MTYEEAERRIIRVLPDDFLKNEENREALSLMGIALEKQIPIKPILDTIFPSGTKWWICPVCECDEIETNDEFCHECGQALDWSDTE